VLGLSCGDSEDDSFLLIYARVDLETIEKQRHFHGGMTDSFVSVYEWVSLNQGERQGCRL
jgi:hypothetical protein